MRDQRKVWIYNIFLILFSYCFVFCCSAEDLLKASVAATPSQKLTLISQKSTIINIPTSVKRVSLADEKIADALVLSPQQIYLTGKVPGVTNLNTLG